MQKFLLLLICISLSCAQELDQWGNRLGLPIPPECQCNNNVCMCCLTIHVTTPPSTTCVRATFDKFNGRNGVELNLFVNGHSYISRVFSDLLSNPPPICLPTIPLISELCLQLYGVKLIGPDNTVCLKVSAKVMGNNVLEFDFQCLHYKDGKVFLGPEIANSRMMMMQSHHLE